MGTTTYHTSYQGRATIGVHAADVDLSAERQMIGTDDGRSTSGRLDWSGRAAIIDPPSFNLLEFVGTVRVTIGDRSGTALVVDATPGSGFIYLQGIGIPPFGECPMSASDVDRTPAPGS